MAGGQGAAGCGRPGDGPLSGNGDERPVWWVTFWSGDQAREILMFSRTIGVELQLYSPAELTCFAGVGFLRSVESALSSRILVDCGDRAGIVMAGLRHGLRQFVYREGYIARSTARSMVEKAGGRLLDAPPAAVIRLDREDRTVRTLRGRLDPVPDTGL